MGVISKQTSKNVIFTYIGFAFGGLNMAFLYPIFLKEEYFGLIVYIMAIANVLMPIMAMGVQNCFVKYFPHVTDPLEKKKWIGMMFFSPLSIITVVLFGVGLFHETIADILAKENKLATDFVWIIYFLAVIFAYFEVFYAWSKVHLKSVFGNILKEIFHRVAVTICLTLIYFEIITPMQFVHIIVWVFFLRTVLMAVSAFRTMRPQIAFGFPKNYKEIFTYGLSMGLSGFVVAALAGIDKVFIGQQLPPAYLAYYSIGAFMATTILIPIRSMHSIISPITSTYIKENNIDGLKNLYKRSSTTLFIISSFVFLIILTNIQEVYKLLPESYSKGLFVVIGLCIARLFENTIGNNNAIYFNRAPFKNIIFLVLGSSLINIVLVYIFLLCYGFTGVVLASLFSYIIYNVLKIWQVYRFYKIIPFSLNTLKILLFIIVFFAVFYFWNFPFHPIPNIILKSLLLGTIYIVVMYKSNLSVDIKNLITNTLKGYSEKSRY